MLPMVPVWQTQSHSLLINSFYVGMLLISLTTLSDLAIVYLLSCHLIVWIDWDIFPTLRLSNLVVGLLL